MMERNTDRAINKYANDIQGGKIEDMIEALYVESPDLVTYLNNFANGIGATLGVEPGAIMIYLCTGVFLERHRIAFKVKDLTEPSNN